MPKLKRNKTVRVDDEMMPLSRFESQNNFSYLRGPFKLSMSIFEEMRKPSSSTRALIFRSICDGDMAFLHKSLEANPSIFAEDFHTTDDGKATALHLACLYNRPEAIELLFKYYQKEQDLKSPLTLTVITMACRFHRLAVIEALLKHGVDPMGRLMYECTVLHIVAYFADAPVAQFIYDGHNITPPVHKTDVDNATPLHYAAQTGNADLCKWLLERGAKVHTVDARRMTPVMDASKSGHDTVVSLLVEAGGHVDCIDDEGMTALHHAAANGQIRVTQLLLSLDTNPNVVTNQGHTPLHLCATCDHPDLVPVLARGGAILDVHDLTNKTPLHWACQNARLDVAMRLIEEGADINSVDDGGVSPLFVACAKGHVDLVTSLLNLGVDYSLVDHLGKTCLHAAVEHGHLEVVTVLLKNCQRPFVAAKDVVEMNALHVAARKDNQIVDVLITYEELTNAQDLMGMTPLHHAARFGTHISVRALAKVTKDIDCQTFDSKTPFFIACEAGNTLSALTLMEMGADVYYRNLLDMTALMMAASNGTTPIVKELLQAGVDVNSTDKKRNSALHYACANGHLPAVKALVEHGASVTCRNVNGRHPLLEAVEGVHCNVATFLMSHESWRESLSVCNGKDRTLMNDMIEYTPQAVKVVLDKCMQTSAHRPNHREYKVNFCYSYIDPSPNSKETYASHALETLIEYKREDILSHPVCQSLLMLKWKSFGRYALLFNVVTQVTFLIVLGIFAILHPKLDLDLDGNGCNIHVTKNSNASLNITKNDDNNEFKEGVPSFSLHVVLYILLGLQFFKELRFIFSTGCRYFTLLNNALMLAALIIIAYILFPYGREFCSLDWRLLCLSLVLIVINNCMMFLRIDFIGIYFSMFFEVMRGILKISILLLFFLFAFSIPFEVTLRHQEGFSRDFPTPLTVLAMTLGELNFRDNFVEGDIYPFTIDVYVIFVAFSLILPVVVVNLMIGVAVGDISKIEKEAYLLRMRNQISFLLLVEKGLPKSLRKRIYRHTYTIQPNDYKGSFRGQVRKWLANDDRIEFIGKSSEVEENEERKEEIRRQNDMIESLKELTTSLQEDIRKLKGDNKGEFINNSDNKRNKPKKYMSSL